MLAILMMILALRTSFISSLRTSFFSSSRTSLVSSFKAFPLVSTRKLRRCYNQHYSTSKSVQASNNNSPSYTVDMLPEETLFIVDGTSMLYSAHFISQAQNNTGFHYLTEETSNLILNTLSKETVERIKKSMETLNKDNIEKKKEFLVDKISCDALIVMTAYFVKLIETTKPKYLAIAFDHGKNTFRKDLFPAYKQQRKETPVELLPLFMLAPRVLELLGCKCFIKEGFEADDLMASLGEWGRQRSLNIVHVCNDKDMIQLIKPGIQLMNPRKNDLVGEKEILEKYNIKPALFKDYQAIIGDSVDNIPGVKGVGPKIAIALLKHFGDIENLYKTLGLDNVPEAPTEFFELSPTSVKIKNHLKTVLTEEVYAHSIGELNNSLKAISAAPTTILARLYLCGYKNIKLYKNLVTLREDLDITTQTLHNFLETETIVNLEKAFLEESNENNKLYDKEQIKTDVIEHSHFFRFRGEDRVKHSPEYVEKELSKICSSLLDSLRRLRITYPLLDRDNYQ